MAKQKYDAHVCVQWAFQSKFGIKLMTAVKRAFFFNGYTKCIIKKIILKYYIANWKAIWT